jgi:hypothetical protein
MKIKEKRKAEQSKATKDVPKRREINGIIQTDPNSNRLLRKS